LSGPAAVGSRRERGRAVRVFVLGIFLLGMASATPACSSSRSEGLDVATLPPEVRGDYEVFAHKCSKCHSLARPLQSGISDDDFWREYVARMRRQPASGIHRNDEEPILRFLHYYSMSKRRPVKGGAEENR
jgi:hypothetical protein